MKPTYQHSPRPVGGPISFTLKEDRLIVDSGRKVHEVRLGAVDTVRMTYEPGRVAQKAFRTKIRMQDGKTFTFSSLNWKSLVAAEDLVEEYRSFTRELFAAIAKANPDARFMAGKPYWLWLSSTAVAAVSLLAMSYLIWMAFQSGATAVALMGVLFAVVGIWQIEPMVRLNKPRLFRPEAPPEELLPGAPRP